MIIGVVYQIPTVVYVDTKTREVVRVQVDDQAPMVEGEIEGVEREDRQDLWGGQITGASRARLLRAHEKIQADATEWPAWEIGF